MLDLLCPAASDIRQVLVRLVVALLQPRQLSLHPLHLLLALVQLHRGAAGRAGAARHHHTLAAGLGRAAEPDTTLLHCVTPQMQATTMLGFTYVGWLCNIYNEKRGLVFL